MPVPPDGAASGMRSSGRHDRRPTAAIWPMALYALLLLVQIARILRLNGGVFTYTLDDPYIHLAVAEGISRGVYGINPGQFAAPSSSILWPWLLAPFIRLPFAHLVPLIFNAVCGWLTVALFFRIIRAGFRSADTGQDDRPDDRPAAVIAALLIPATNLVGLVLTGMEHSLQVLVATVVIHGWVVMDERARPPWWFLAALVLGPLIRYEMFALTLPALGVLLIRRQWAAAVGTGIVVAGLTGAFSLFLVRHGLEALPTSVTAKSDVFTPGGSLAAALAHFRGQLDVDGRAIPRVAIAMLLLATAVRRSAPLRARHLAACCAVAALGFALGGTGAYGNRYEVFVWVALLLALLYVHAGAVVRFIVDARGPLALTVGLLAVPVLSWNYVREVALSDLGANNIHQQQYQMHRFIADFHRGPVAANDIGCLAYRNEHAVVDLAGIVAPGVWRQRLESEDVRWMDTAARAAGARCAMVYEDWFRGIPVNWVPVAELHLGRRRVSCAGSMVTFFATEAGEAAALREQLRAFGATLPSGVRLEFRGDHQQSSADRF